MRLQFNAIAKQRSVTQLSFEDKSSISSSLIPFRPQTSSGSSAPRWVPGMNESGVLHLCDLHTMATAVPMSSLCPSNVVPPKDKISAIEVNDDQHLTA